MCSAGFLFKKHKRWWVGIWNTLPRVAGGGGRYVGGIQEPLDEGHGCGLGTWMRDREWREIGHMQEEEIN